MAEVIPFEPVRTAPTPLVDGVHDYPDITESSVELAPLVSEPEEPLEDTHPSLFDPAELATEAYRLPDRSLLRQSTSTGGGSAETSARVAETLERKHEADLRPYSELQCQSELGCSCELRSLRFQETRP